MGHHISVSISVESPSDEILNRGLLALLLRQQYEFPLETNIVQFSIFSITEEMMMSLLWYYQPEHTEAGRQDHDMENEVFASRHRDENSVACIDDKCYVLTYQQFCR